MDVIKKSFCPLPYGDVNVKAEEIIEIKLRVYILDRLPRYLCNTLNKSGYEALNLPATELSIS